MATRERSKSISRSSMSDDTLAQGGRSHPSFEGHMTGDRDTRGTMTGDTNFSTSEHEGEEYDLSPDLAERLVKRTEMRVAQVVSSSVYVQSNCGLYELPRFEREDLNFGNMIAFGGFSNVYELESFNVETELMNEEAKKDERRYVIKHLNPKLASSPKKLVVGAKDLVMEAHFLSALTHENIIGLRAWSSPGISGFATAGRADGFFLILDRLEFTLAKQISFWREEAKQQKGLLKGRSDKQKSFATRLKVALQVANAVDYLHDRRILFRDLKPANIGFDKHEVLKIFDFGLAVEIPDHPDPDTTFKLAGNTGTSRYMAVEVIRKEPYNLKADVFSYSILLWEILALSKPYEGLMGQQVKESVSVYGERPSVPRSWPQSVRKLLRSGWGESILARPTMKEVCKTLEKA
ncbi:unnamed protein product [Cylindrotheca closterium]|uniref:Protein kinase domain-containing protein n=1 Tax=Cylindrotheca closterium TaxID=2856 RepID=A0AAD2GAH9_9STRA|nr:unnamed protein product [Cylindrotheca closterium]